MIPAGSRVAIRQRLLEPSERAPGLPEDTAGLPYESVVRGQLLEPARLGEPASIRTAAGRTLHGVLDQLDPADTHGFGTPHPALVAVDLAITRLLEDVHG